MNFAFCTPNFDDNAIRNVSFLLPGTLVPSPAADPDEAVLLRVVQPVPRAPGADEALELVRLHPQDLLHALVAPDLHACDGSPGASAS